MTVAALVLSALTAAAPPVAAIPPHVAEGGEQELRLRLRLNTAVTYGIGGQSFLGALAHLVAYTPVWDARRATGTLDLGVQLHYGNEPVALAPWLRGTDVRGAAHRVQLLVTAGHTFYLGKRRRAGLGLHLFAGLNAWRSAYSLDYPTEMIHGSAVVARNKFVAGGQLMFDVRLARRVGLYLLAGGPFPSESSYVVTIFSVGIGLTFYLR